MSTEIRHNVAIKATPEKIYKAVTTQEELTKEANWDLSFNYKFKISILKNKFY